MNTVEAVLEQVRVEGNVIVLPLVQLDRKLYEGVAKKLTGIGGKWNKKAGGFLFPQDPTPELARVLGGKNVNLKKEFQFFETPAVIADQMVALAEVEPFHSILEPSAGQGAIVKAVNRVMPLMEIDCFELMEANRRILDTISTVRLLGDDFMSAPITCSYDRIIANPPFTKNQDIDHIERMLSCLAPGGRLVTIASISWVTGTQRKQQEFSAMVDAKASVRRLLPRGAFKESGTDVPAMLLVFDF